MSHFRVMLAAVAAAFGVARAEAAPLEAYGRLPAIEDARISPAGANLAVVVTNGEQRKIAIRDLATGVTQVLDTGGVKVRSIAWAGEDNLLITTTATTSDRNIVTGQGEYAQLFAYNLTTHALKQQMQDMLFQVFGQPMARTVDGKLTVLLSGPIYADHDIRSGLVQLNLERGTSRVVNNGFANTYDWVVGPDGAPLAEAEYDSVSGKWAMRTRWKGDWTVARTLTSLQETPELMGLGRDGASVLVSDLIDGRRVLKELSPETGKWSDPIADSEGASPLFGGADHRMIGLFRLDGDAGHMTFFDPLDQRIWRAVAAAYPGDHVELLSWSDDHRKIVARVDSATTGPALALVDLTQKSASWLGDEYPELKSVDIAPVEAVTYKAADGLELTGYLTLPKGRQAKNLPLVVLPHGGPAARDEPGFDWWSQALAARGYAVLRVNFRGSDGFGWPFLQAGFGQWGRKMQTDLSDGVRFLAGKGEIDPQRVCIVGASYGGYAALAGVTLEPGVYRCAASVAGIGDLKKFLSFSHSERGLGALRWWTRFLGLNGQGDAKVQEISPIAHVAAVTAPVLLVHGKDDVVVPYEQSILMEKALRGAGKSVELVTLEGEDHWLSKGETRRQMLSAVVAFLEKNNPPN